MHWNVLGLGEYSDPDWLGGFFKHYTCQELMPKLKADWPHPRDYQPMPPDYRHTDKNPRTGMTTLYSKFEGNCLLLHSAQAEPLISTATSQTFDPGLWPWPQPLTLTPKKGKRQNTILSIWPLTYDLDLLAEKAMFRFFRGRGKIKKFPVKF